ncbi:MAG TPA: M36 family metallopeptidase, partial [Labilithrix sp.]|nr:M36 family metallopeptidase [Labilithrix sp.]
KDLDGALDDQIVSHEWGHVLSNRLVSDGSGLDTNMAGGLGEGWADFVAQLVSVRAEDALVAANAGWNGVYPSATYATGGDSEFYFGIRRVPYSTDMTKDPLTYRHIADGEALPNTAPVSFGEDGSSNSEVHNTGEVWATMLWECYAALLRDGRFTFQQAQDRMKSYLVASLKLTPPSPTMLEARDAVIAAAYANDPKDFELFWKAFAKRGAGVGAVAPPRDAVDNNPVKESFEVGNAASLVSLSIKDDVITCDHDGIMDEGELGTIVVKIRNSGAGTLNETTAKLSSKSANVSFPDKGIVKFEPFKPFEEKTALVKAYIDGVAEKEPLIIDIAVDDPTMVVGGSLAITLPVRHGVDEIADSSLLDEVETNGTAWTVAGTDQTGTSVKWARILTETNHSWFIPNAGEPADHQLTSPAFEVTDSAFTLAWKHRWSFESSEKDMKDFDGGVVEITLDNGKTWEDLSKYGKVDYNVTLEDDPNTTMVLKGRKAYGHDSPGYPDTWVNSKVVVSLPTAQATVKVRFRHGADDNSASVGWEIDDISVTDLNNKPFWSFVPQRDQCDPAGPTAIAPPGQTTTPKTIVRLLGTGTHPKGLPLGFNWRQVAGPSVYLSGRDTPEMAFEAPATKQPVTLTFALRANDGALLSAPANVDVVVSPAAPIGGDDSACGCHVVSTSNDGTRALWTAGLAGLAIVLVRRRRQRRAS